MSSRLTAVGEDMKEEMMGKFEKYHVEDALRDIERGEMHKKDDELMEQVSKLAAIKVEAISSIADLRKRKRELKEGTEEN